MKEKVNKEKLLQKYYEGETTMAEEKWLKEHILSENTSVEQLIFNDLHTLKQNFSDKSAAKKKNKKIKMVVLSSFAAAACLLLFFWKPFDRSFKQQEFGTTITNEILVSRTIEGSIDDPDVALEQARKALTFVSDKLNTGTENMNHLIKLNQVKE